jgi:hypothetical protein
MSTHPYHNQTEIVALGIVFKVSQKYFAYHPVYLFTFSL